MSAKVIICVILKSVEYKTDSSLFLCQKTWCKVLSPALDKIKRYMSSIKGVWCGKVWYGMVWYGMVWYGMSSIKGGTGGDAPVVTALLLFPLDPTFRGRQTAFKIGLSAPFFGAKRTSSSRSLSS